MDQVRHTFPKSENLKSKKTIELLFKKGKSINEHPVRLKFLPKHEPAGVSINVGFSVPKKMLKLAVQRNLMKRRMREAYRLNNQALKLQLENKNLGYDMMFIYTTKQLLSYQDLEEKIKVILTRLLEASEVGSE